MPISFCYALAYVLSCVSPSVMVPSLINLFQQGYGHKRGVISSLITAGTFDDIICIIIFGICKVVIEKQYGILSGSSSRAIGFLFLDIVVGFFAGLFWGLVGFAFRLNKKYPDLNLFLKATYYVGCAIMFVLVGEIALFTISNYIASLTLGYVANRV